MKIKLLLLVFGFLVIFTKPVGAISLHDNETEISCYVDSFDCEIVTVDLLGLDFNYAGDAGVFYDGFKESIVGEARPPTLEISRGYYTKELKRSGLELNIKALLKRPRDGLMQLV